MKSVLLISHILAVVLAAACVWSIRFELTKRPTTPLGFALPPVLALLTAAILLAVSPGKRLEFWVVAILAGTVMGLGAGMLLKVDKDFERSLVRVRRTYDGIAVATLLLLLALMRFVTSDLIGRQSQSMGVLGAVAAFLAFFLAGRVVTLRYYTARKAIHLDMKRPS